MTHDTSGLDFVPDRRPDLTALRSAAASVLERVDLLTARWERGAVGVVELDALAQAVCDLRVDLERHAAGGGLHEADVRVLRAMRVGIDAAIEVVVGLLCRSAAWSPESASH